VRRRVPVREGRVVGLVVIEKGLGGGGGGAETARGGLGSAGSDGGSSSGEASRRRLLVHAYGAVLREYVVVAGLRAD